MPSSRNNSSRPSLLARCRGFCCGTGDEGDEPYYPDVTPLPDSDGPRNGGTGGRGGALNGGGRWSEPGGTFDTNVNMSGVYEELRRKCLREGKLYEDKEFRPVESNLFQGGIIYSVDWKRPREIVSRPEFFHGNPDYYDMEQGEIGNCWFVASVACLAASPQKRLLDRVVPRDQGFDRDYCGAFRFWFWQYGKWKEVIVDDRLPTYKGVLLYGRNRTYPQEFWCPLLEKAYAKLHGDYNTIDGGRIHTSLVDLTGGMGEMVPLKTSISLPELKEMIINCQKMNSIMGGAIFQKKNAGGRREIKLKNGLYSGHAYSILKIKEVDTREGTKTILHMRNPWGRGEWNGAWADGTREWYSLRREDRTSTYRTRDDGEFWISLEDFRDNFDELEMCHLTPDALSDEIAANLDRSQWKITEHYGSWVKGLSAGGPARSFTSAKFWSNPQFELSLVHAKKPTTVVVSLFEVESKPIRYDINIGFVIFKLGPGRKPRRITADNFYEYNPRLEESSGPFWPYRERTVRFEMDPAHHVIVPCTFQPDQEAQFYMRVFSEEEMKSGPVAQPINPGDEDVPPTPMIKTNEERVANEEFDKLAGLEGMIDAAELELVFGKALVSDDKTQKAGFNTETCRCLVGLANTKSSKGLIGKEDFQKLWSDLYLWRKAFKAIDVNKSGTLDASELKELFRLIDFGDSKEAVEGIMKRYGGKKGKISEEDFLQGFCKTLQLFTVYRELEAERKLSLTLGEWIYLGFRS
ncbi:calpain-9 [Aplysia californica]|uniref:Calpain-9 n=1 Tax=Aplysia californica TaxID=6500 RepID=A0ABM0JHK2_APLCA|nr:calpain-9 [Aplysia californica]